jgi:hypothetical protein
VRTRSARRGWRIGALGFDEELELKGYRVRLRVVEEYASRC